ncbi:hypothetical protein C0995_013318 [Termitomyces sp. Mi166|nr:hypothetical protein C0995_013318 [Termitomyces sp. Mi166\
MPTGATTAESSIYSSLFGYARPAQTSLASASLQIHSAQGEQSGGNALGSTLMQDLAGVVNEDDDDEDIDVPSTMSASCSADPISSSPAAMFLSVFSSPKPSAPQPDSEGDVISGYTLGPIIGHGAFSTIRRAFSASGDAVAVKIIRRSDHFKRGSDSALAKKRIKREAQVWAILSHEHILPLFSAAHTPYADYFFTLFCPAGSLFDILKRDGRPELPHDDVGTMFRQVVRGLRYMHDVALFVHRDIKLENVLVDESGVCRIGDFGMTKRIGEPDEDEEDQDQQQTEIYHQSHITVHRAVSLNVPSPRVGVKGISLQAQLARHRNSTSSAHPTPPPKFQPGSLPYAAPELLLPQVGPVIPKPAQDIWALGVVLYTLLTGRLPFSDSFEPRLQTKILNGVFEVPSGIGRGAERVLKGCLDRSDITRWNIAMVDEVAWGVGWGPESDDITSADSDEEFQVSSHSRSRSRHRLKDAIPEDPEWHQQEPSSHPVHDAASRRSSSRLKRSLSRAPHSRPTLTTRSNSRSRRALSPSVTTFNAIGTPARSQSVARSPSGLRSRSSTRSSHFFDPNLDPPSASSFERGRRRQKFFPSDHSPSPSIAVPMTPSDSLGPDSHLDRSSSRGRRPKVEFNTAPPPFSEAEHLYVAEELETLEVSQNTTFGDRQGRAQVTDMVMSRWAQRSRSKPSYDPTLAFSISRRGSKRSGSTPPNEEAWPRPLLTGNGDLKGLFNFPTTLLKSVRPMTAVDRRMRSRSLELSRNIFEQLSVAELCMYNITDDVDNGLKNLRHCFPMIREQLPFTIGD